MFLSILFQLFFHEKILSYLFIRLLALTVEINMLEVGYCETVSLLALELKCLRSMVSGSFHLKIQWIYDISNKVRFSNGLKIRGAFLIIPLLF